MVQCRINFDEGDVGTAWRAFVSGMDKGVRNNRITCLYAPVFYHTFRNIPQLNAIENDYLPCLGLPKWYPRVCIGLV